MLVALGALLFILGFTAICTVIPLMGFVPALPPYLLLPPYTSIIRTDCQESIFLARKQFPAAGCGIACTCKRVTCAQPARPGSCYVNGLTCRYL